MTHKAPRNPRALQDVEELDARDLYREAFNFSVVRDCLPREEALQSYLITKRYISINFPKLRFALPQGRITNLWRVGIDDKTISSLGKFFTLSGLARKQGRTLIRTHNPPKPDDFTLD